MIYFARNIFNNQHFLIDAEVLAGSLHEVLPPADDLAVEGVDNRVGLLQESIYPANLLQVQFPLGWMLDDYPEIDVLVFAADPAGYFLALPRYKST